MIAMKLREVEASLIKKIVKLLGLIKEILI